MKKPLLIVLLITVISAVIGYNFSGGKKPKIMQRADAELILKNLAVGMRMYSSMTGGGGEVQFTGDMAKIQRNVMQDAYAACTQKQPFHGVIVELTEYPEGDNFKTNFRFIAKPAPGFVGESLAIDKSEEIISLDNLEK